MEFLSLLLYLVSIYYTYYKSSRHNANPFLWTGVGFCLPFLSSLIAFLYFRKKPVANKRASRLPLGYRSRTPWKMTLSSIVYGLLILVISVGMLTDSPQNQSGITKTQNESNIASTTKLTTAEAETSSGEPKNDSKQKDSINQGQNTQNNSDLPAKIENLKVHFIDVGQADSILIVTPAKKAMLIDAGNNADGDAVVSYLKSQGISRIDVLIGTHPHEDHIGGMDTVIKNFNIGKIYMPKVANTTKTFQDVLNVVRNKGLKVTNAKGYMDISFDSAVKAEILAPNGSSYEDLNNYSVVTKLTYGKTTFLFTGDAEDISEQEILAAGYGIKADVLKVGHHGSSSSTTEKFLDSVNPKYAVIMVGRDNDYGHPHRETMSRLKDRGITVYRTDQNGTVIAQSNGNDISFNVKPGNYSYNSDGKTVQSYSAAESGNRTENKTAPVTTVQSNPKTTSGEKLYVDAQGNGLIKGNINSKKEKIYHLPGEAYYDRTDPEVWFKTETEAQAAGFRPSKR